MILTVDIGGTKTMWSLWEDGRVLQRGRETTVEIRDFCAFIQEKTAGKDMEAISFAIAGPIRNNKLELTNTGQIIDLGEIKERFSHVPRIRFLNDLEALAYSLSALQANQISEYCGCCETCGQLPEKGGAKAVISLGTGLGIAAVTREGVVMPSEGGHVDFAPVNHEQRRLLDMMEKKYGGHVSYERLLSGMGLSNIYAFMEAERGEVKDQGTDEIEETEPAEISKRAAAGEATALEAFRLFTEILGAACGNFAMTFMASGGVYLGGGMTPKILPFIDKNVFVQAFTDKGRFCQYLGSLGVYAIMDEAAPSLGAACAVSDSFPL